MRKFEIYRRVLPSLIPIILRNLIQLVNAIILVVVILLFAFGSGESGLFLGIIFALNTLIAIIQDIRARILLEKLQMLTELRVTRLNPDKTESLVLAEEIKKGDLIKLKIGDQVPVEGLLISATNLEISEALITGESDSFPKNVGDNIMAGAIISSGYGTASAQNTFGESRLSTIKEDVKKYATSPSSIQQATNTLIKYAGLILLGVILFTVLRGLAVHATRLEIVTNVGALASTIVPQGLLVVITLLFAIGAGSYSKRNVLFQEINATEKLGRIKNLCIDKTGTLTNNILEVETMHVYPGLTHLDEGSLRHACIFGLGETSETVLAVKKYLEKNSTSDKNSLYVPDGESRSISKIIPFSSWRRYGAVEVKHGEESKGIYVGAVDVFLPHILNIDEKKWLEDLVSENSKEGKRVLCVVSESAPSLSVDIVGTKLEVMALFVFYNTLRDGIVDAIKFFQERGVQIRVLSGDSKETVQVVAKSVGIEGTENIITGKEISKWTEEDYYMQAYKYNVFAEILPEHKVKLVEIFKKDGFTAMVGDGVNDALAMKKSDLGIAMFDGAPVTRGLAGVILMTNSFTDLPGAVELADHFIRSIEISASIYINQSLVGLFFFIIISFFGYSYPLTPLNITFINYFTVGFTGLLIAYWAIRPMGKVPRANRKPFLKRIMPLVVACSIVQAIGVSVVFALSPKYLKTAPSNSLVMLSLLVFGFIFLILSANVYCRTFTKREKIHLTILGIFEAVVLLLALQIPFVINFFNITIPFPSSAVVGESVLVFIVFGFVQYFIVKSFFLNTK